MNVIRVELPYHLRNIAGVDAEVRVELPAQPPAAACVPSIQSVLDELERRFPALRGTIRDHTTLKRRAFLRFFACGEDLSHNPPEQPLPDAVVRGIEPLLIIGAIAGG